jgi:uncharacterized protein YfcZ (UPF0381/DUF406 family)
MNVLTTISECSAPLDTYATTLAQIQQIMHDNADKDALIAQLRADLHHANNQISFLTEQFNRVRNESLRFRMLLTELATQMASIALLTIKGQEIVQVVHEIDDAPVPSTEALDVLEAEFKQGNSEA